MRHRLIWLCTTLLLAAAVSWAGQSATVAHARFANPRLLGQHFQKHGAEFGARSAAEYEAMAAAFIESATRGDKGIRSTSRANGDRLFYRDATNEFSVLSKDGFIRTYFKPDQGLRYWNNQLRSSRQ